MTAGKWCPHRQPARGRQPPRQQKCANRRCTKGEDGGPARRLVHLSRLDRLESAWTCSPECRKTVGGKRPQWRTVQRECACDNCDGVVWVTKRQAREGKGPQRCEVCQAANRLTPRQREARAENTRRLNADPRLTANAAKRRTDRGRRNSRSPTHMDRFISGRMQRHADDKRERDARIEAVLIADPTKPNTALARELHCANVNVMWVRCDLEEAARIPLRDGVPQKRPDARYVRRAEYDRDMQGRVRSRARSRARQNTGMATEARAQADRAEGLHAQGWDVAEIAEELTAAVPTVERYLRDRGRSEASPGRREAKQRRRIIRHLTKAAGSDRKRDIQRATKIPAAALAARLRELDVEHYKVNGEACVRLVSPKTITLLSRVASHPTGRVEPFR
jgi:hypothetical protein